jgi:hypothetical protein
VFPPRQPGGGGVALRRQLGVLRRFMDRFDLVKMRPAPELVVSGVPDGGSVQALAQGEDAVGVYLRRQQSPSSFSARWRGLLVPPASGTYRIHVTSNDGVRLIAGGRVLLEDWTDHGTKTDTVSVEWEAGREQSITAEYFYNGGAGVIRLEWTRPDGVREVVPVRAWRVRADGSERRTGLRADYFRGADLGEPWFSRDEATIDHDFGSTGPRRDVPAAAASSTLNVTLPPGRWAGSWIDPETGQTIDTLMRQHAGGVAPLTLPRWKDDLALDLRRVVTP